MMTRRFWLFLLVATAAGCGGSSGNAPGGQGSATPPTAEPQWVSAAEPVTLGPIRLSVESVSVGPATITSATDGAPREIAEQAVIVWLSLKNIDKESKVDFASWSALDSTSRLVDDRGNNYRPIQYLFDGMVEGASLQASLYPGDQTRDCLFFERPVPGFSHLRLTLDGELLDQQEDIRFEIPASMVQKQ